MFVSDVAGIVVVVVGSVAVAFVFVVVVDDVVVNPSQNKQGETVISFQLLRFFIESQAIFFSKVLSLTSFFATDKCYSLSSFFCSFLQCKTLFKSSPQYPSR